jgi:uncharacterized protein DUF1559
MSKARRSHSALGAAFTVLSLCLASLGNDAAALADDVANVEPYIVEPTCVVVKLDTARLAVPGLFDQLADFFPVTSLGTPSELAEEGIDTLHKASGEQPVYATIGIPFSNRELPAYVFLKQTPQVSTKTLETRLGGGLTWHSHNGMLVTMLQPDTDVAANLAQLTPAPRGELKDAFAAVADHPIQILVLPPDFVRRTVVEMQPTLPPILGGGPSSTLTDGLVWGAIGADPGKSQAKLVIQSASDQAAQNLGVHLSKIVESLYQAMPDIQQRMPRDNFDALASLISSSVEGDRLVIRIADPKAADNAMQFVAGIITTFQEPARRRKNSNNLKQIMIALHNYHDAYSMFPPRDEVRDKEGKSGLSWRVHILPFVEEQKLYDQFHLDEPWDSPHNKTLIARMPKVYGDDQRDTPAGQTTFLAPVGEDTVFGGRKACKFYQIGDGTSNTVAVVQSKPELAVPWTAPEDYAFDSADPAAGLNIDSDGRFMAGVADGSIRNFRGDAKPETLLHLFQKSDGEPIEWEEVR